MIAKGVYRIRENDLKTIHKKTRCRSSLDYVEECNKGEMTYGSDNESDC